MRSFKCYPPTSRTRSCCAARHRQGTGSRTHLRVPWWVVPKEVGAPARGIGGALAAPALTPRVEDLTPVLGPGIHPHGPVSLQPPRLRVEVAGPLAAGEH